MELVGFILPPFIDLINRKVTNSNVRYLISLLVSLLVAGIIKYFDGGLIFGDVDQVLASAGIIFAEAQTVYKLYWEDSKVRATLVK